MSKLTVARALTAHIALRVLRAVTLAVFAIFVLIVIVCGLLAHFFSPWWWLLLIPFVGLVGVFVIILLLFAIFIAQVHSQRLTKPQRDAMDDFVDKIQQLVEARSTPLPLFALITLKDLLVHRDVTTIKRLVSDTAGLRRDFDALERLF